MKKKASSVEKNSGINRQRSRKAIIRKARNKRRGSTISSAQTRPVKTLRWVGTGQLALNCGISPQTIRNDIERGKLHGRQTGTGRYLISRLEADRYMVENGYATS